MHTAVFIFQLLSLAKMLTICCSAVDVYVSTEKRTWAASHQDKNCNLAKSSGNITINHTVPHGPTLAWVNETMCSNRRVWINMTGCFNLTITSNRSRHFPVPGYEDPVVFCLQECHSDKVFLTSTECYCSEYVEVTSDSPCQGSRCGKHNNRLCGSNGNNDTKCVCGYVKTNISTNESGNCMSTKVSGNKFIYRVQHCSQQMSVLCTINKIAHSALTGDDQKTNWTGALTKCSKEGNFNGVKNGSNAYNLNDINVTLWIGLFSVELTQLTCMAININNDGHTIIQKNCSQLLQSLCINQTATTSTNQTMEQTSTPVATFQGTTHSSVTGYPSTSSQTHSLPKENAITSSSSTSSPDDVSTHAITKCDNLSSGFADPSIHTTDNTETSSTTTSTTTTTTTTTTTLSTKNGQPNEKANRKSSSGFPTLTVGFGTGGAVALILVLFMLVIFYRRRKRHRSNNSKKDVPKSYDGNSTNTQQNTSKTMIKDNNDHTAEHRILSKVLSDDTEESARLGDYDHLETHKNRELTHKTHNHGRPAEAFYHSTYDHVGHQLVSSQTDQDGSTYNTFSQKNESVLFSGVDYDHIVRNTDMYDHMGTGSVTTAVEADYDHTGSGERLWSGTGRHGTGNIAPKNGNTFHDHPSSEGNYDNKGGNGQWHTLNSDRPRNDQDKYSTEAQYDHLPSTRVKREISHSHEGDYDHTFAVDDYDHIGSVNKGHRRSVVQEDEYDHVTEL